MKRFSENLSSARQSMGYSQAELARRINATKSTISQYESGYIKSVDGEKLIRLSKELFVSPDWLLYGKTSIDDEKSGPSSIAEKPAFYGVTEEKGIKLFCSLQEKKQLIFIELMQDTIAATTLQDSRVSTIPIPPKRKK